MCQPCKQLDGLLSAFNDKRVCNHQIVAVTNLQCHCNIATASSQLGHLSLSADRNGIWLQQQQQHQQQQPQLIL